MDTTEEDKIPILVYEDNFRIAGKTYTSLTQLPMELFEKLEVWQQSKLIEFQEAIDKSQHSLAISDGRVKRVIIEVSELSPEEADKVVELVEATLSNANFGVRMAAGIVNQPAEE